MSWERRPKGARDRKRPIDRRRGVVKEREWEGRELYTRPSCNERCGERRVLFGGVTKFHERVSPLQPVFAREGERKKQSLVCATGREERIRKCALVRACERERERVRKIGRGTTGWSETRAEDGERDIPRAGEENGSGAEVKRTRRGDPLLPRVRLFVIASFSRAWQEGGEKEGNGIKKENEEKKKRSESRRDIVCSYDLEECVVSEWIDYSSCVTSKSLAGRREETGRRPGGGEGGRG